MNRRKFFAGLALTPVLPVAAVGATDAPSSAYVIDFDNLPHFTPNEVRAFVIKHKGNPTLHLKKTLSEHVGADGFVRRDVSGGFVCLDGKVVGMIAFEPGYFRESDIHAALHAGRITPNTARALRA